MSSTSQVTSLIRTGPTGPVLDVPCVPHELFCTSCCHSDVCSRRGAGIGSRHMTRMFALLVVLGAALSGEALSGQALSGQAPAGRSPLIDNEIVTVWDAR